MFFKQLLLVTLKNFRLQLRRPAVSFIELSFPIISVLLLVVIRLTIEEFKPQDQCFVTYESDHLIQPNTGNFTIFYTPNSSDTQFIASVIESQLSGGKLIPVDSADDIEDLVERLNESRTFGCFLSGAGIIFDLQNPDISYTLRLRHATPTREPQRARWYTRLRSPLSAPSGPRVYDNAYLNEGFLHLEHFTNLAIIQWITGRWPDEISSIAMKQMPYPNYIIDDFLVYVSFILPLMMVAAFLLTVGLFTKDLVREKESRIRETLKIMGLSNLVIGMSWAAKQFLFMLIPTLLFAAILKYSTIFPKSHLGALMILMLCYLISMISFSFLVSVWFNSSKLGMIAAFIFWFLTYIPHLFISQFFDTIALGVKVSSCLFSNTCIGIAIDVISILELRGEGFQFSDFYTPLSVDDKFNMYAVVGMLLFDSILYSVIAWYINEIKPGEYGIRKKYYFPFQVSYWTGKPFKFRHSSRIGSTTRINHDEEMIVQSSCVTTTTSEYNINSAHELVSPQPVIGIEVKGLVKTFKPHQYSGTKQVNAVNNVDLKIYKGQITALLGHNAAGKTTLISLITSLYPPTEGSVLINGIDQLKNVNTLNANIGICPQYNLLFDDLTVTEHLEFFAKLKGVKNVKGNVENIISELEMKKFSKVKAHKLSGGYKRKLSVGIALVGDPDVLILDEPTSGMDYIGKNRTWRILQEKKNSNRTILLTTHNMDDAEKADRIAIMVEGKLACSGTPSFLKKRYGVGYNLRIEMTNEEHIQHINRIVEVICDDYEKHCLRLEVQFLLPYKEMPRFSQLFVQLERYQNQGKIKNFSVQENRMVDVFIKVREGNYLSWETRIKQVSRILSAAPTINIHRPVIPFRNSVISMDLIHGFQGTDETSLTRINEDEGSIVEGYPVVEPSLSNNSRAMTLSGSGVLYSGIGPGRERRSSSMSSNRSKSIGGHSRRTPVTPSILHPIYPTITEDVRSEENLSNHSDSTNSGLVIGNTKRWLQQYNAILLKRYYNFIRFRVGFIWQFIFPILFVTLGLVLAYALPSVYENDPERTLTLSNSAPEENRKLFWGDFSKSDFPFDIEDLSSDVFGNPTVEDISESVNSIRDAVKIINDTRDCCDYSYQILDSFCAQQTQEELYDKCHESEDFGYYKCLNRCLSCCSSKEHQLPSCTNPRYQQIDSYFNAPVASNFCPTPPRLSTFDQGSSSPLHTLDTFVNEFLLIKASNDVTFQRTQLGGLIIMDNIPAYTSCQCDDHLINTDLVDPINSLIADSCKGRTPIVSSYCNENEMFDSLFAKNISSFGFTTQIGDDIDNACIASQIDLANSESCFLSLYCQDETCSDCRCFNKSLNSWYGEMSSESNVSIVIWYNNEHYHISPALLSIFHNLYLAKIVGNYSITVRNHPLPRDAINTATTVEADIIIFAVGMLTSFGFSFLAASYALFIVHENVSKAKHLQLVSGLNRMAYWLANLTWDMLSSLLPVTISFLLFVISRFFFPHFSELINLFAVFCLLLLFCWAEVPLIYLVSLPFQNIYTAYTSIFIFTSMSCLAFLSLSYLIGVVLRKNTVASILHYIFLVNPSYGLASGLSDIYYNYVVSETCTKSQISLSSCKMEDINFFEHPFELTRPGIGVTIMYLLIEGIIFAILTILIDERGRFMQFIGRKKNWTLRNYHEHAKKRNQDVKMITRNARPQSSYNRPRSAAGDFALSMSQHQMKSGLKRSASRLGEDVSVRRERRNVGNLFQHAQKNGLGSDHSLALSRVSKQYNEGLWTRIRTLWTAEDPALPAVTDVNLTVKDKECFGLAGFNGAGKSTIFKILTGDIQCTTGVATICGLNISTHFSEVRKYLGYCPQFDALVERMTGREILTMFGRIKGLTSDVIQKEVKDKLDLLNLNEHADKLCWKYSGGNKRKLSAAVALIGDPKVILLDEPTTGMDIETRGRFIRMLKELVEKKKTSIILTSHSMGECEAICNRIGILIKGEFRCIGSTEELKAKYGEQTTKIVIQVESDTQTHAEEDSQLTLDNSQNFRHTPSMYKRLQSFSRVFTSTTGPTVHTNMNAIDEESEPSDIEEDEVDVGNARHINVDYIEDVEDQGCTVNRYLVEVCRKFETEFSTVNTIKMMGMDCDEVSYKLPRTVVPLSKIFEVMERMKKQSQYHVVNYSVSQSSLEQVYYFFANEQRD